jgi:hypothetical protein
VSVLIVGVLYYDFVTGFHYMSAVVCYIVDVDIANGTKNERVNFDGQTNLKP